MKLRKNTLYILLHLLSGDATASAVRTKTHNLDIRSIQRALEHLTELGLVKRSGPKNSPAYAIDYLNLLTAVIPEKILDDENRPESSFNHEFINWLYKTPAKQVEQSFENTALTPDAGNKISAKELEYLTVELSWKSSALEGNTYTLLDTQLLLTEGIKAKGRTEFETQMIINHKDAVTFIVENPNLFGGKINFATIKELHKIIGRNLGIAGGIRKRLVKISASNYVPLASPQQLRENADKTLEIIGQFTDPYVRSLMALSLIPYLQAFEDGNKRTGRMLANAILISTVGKGFSLRKVSPRELALAYLAFYEFNSMKPLDEILTAELSS